MPQLILLIKVLVLCVIAIAIRGTLPRYRFDQLLQLAWKYGVFILLAFLILSLLVIAFLT